MNEIALRAPSDNEFNIVCTIARNAAASGLYNGTGNEQKILMVLLAAREMGIGYMEALNGGLWNIQGKIEISARLMGKMIRKAGHSIQFIIHNSEQCTLKGVRSDNGDTCESTFTIEDAKTAGLIRAGGNWIKYAEDMLYARALSRLGRRLFSDVIGNAYIEGEIKDAINIQPINKEAKQVQADNQKSLETIQADSKISLEKKDPINNDEYFAYCDQFGDDRNLMMQFIEEVSKQKDWYMSKAFRCVVNQFKDKKPEEIIETVKAKLVSLKNKT